MRLLGFTLLAIVVGTVIHFGLSHLPYYVHNAMHGIDIALMFVLPVIVTVGLAYTMGVWNWYVVFLSILSPFLSWILMFLVAVFVFNEHAYI
jgi:hypothetical protein